MIHIALYEPEIPPNTGNIIRLAANMGCQLHLIYPMGFRFDDSRLKRAGLDYWEWATIQHHETFGAFLNAVDGHRIFACSTKGMTNYSDIQYQSDDVFLFGPETRGLPSSVLDSFPPNQIIRIPMKPNSRSLNLSNACAVITYEAWRQLGFSAC